MPFIFSFLKVLYFHFILEHIYLGSAGHIWWSLLVLFYLYCQLIASIIRNDKLGQFILYKINIVQKFIAIKNILNWHLSLLIFCSWSNSIFFGNLQIISVLLREFLRTKCQQGWELASCSIRMLIKMSTRILIVNCWHQQVTLQCQCKQYIVFCREKHFV